MNTFQRLGNSPTGAYHCDTLTDADGMTYHEWRHATPEEAAKLKDPRSDPNYGHGQIFGYEQTAFLRRQYR